MENRILIMALFGAAFPSLGQASLPRDLSLGGNDENAIALSCKSKSGTRIFNKHSKENRGSDCHPNGLRPRTVGGHSDGSPSVIRPHLRQWPVEMSTGAIKSTTGVSGMLARRGPKSSRTVLLDALIRLHFDRSGLPRYFDGIKQPSFRCDKTNVRSASPSPALSAQTQLR